MTTDPIVDTQAACLALGISRSTFHRLRRRHGIQPVGTDHRGRSLYRLTHLTTARSQDTRGTTPRDPNP